MRYNICYQSSTSRRSRVYAATNELQAALDLAGALADCGDATVSWVCDTRDGSVPWQSAALPDDLRRTAPPDFTGGA